MELESFFYNNVGRLRSGWRFIIFILAFVASMYIVSTLVRIGYALILLLVPAFTPGRYYSDFIFRLIFLFSALLAGLFCTRWLEGLRVKALGLTRHVGWVRDFLLGSAVGIASLALATAIATAGGGLEFSFSGNDMLVQVGKTLLFSALLFIFAAMAEEVLFRGYPLQTFIRARLPWLGILLTSLAFAAVHLGNPDVVPGLTFLNTALAGVWLGVAYLRTRSLWLPVGVHWAWNWAQGSLFGLPVSGITHVAPNPLLRGTDVGATWLTGGGYGIEGGVACTVALLISTLFIWRAKMFSATHELLELTSRENPAKPTPVLSVLSGEANSDS